MNLSSSSFKTDLLTSPGNQAVNRTLRNSFLTGRLDHTLSKAGVLRNCSKTADVSEAQAIPAMRCLQGLHLLLSLQ